jgi:hypothetical protein
MQNAKNQLTDLRSLRERYNRIMEEQVVRPLQSDLQGLRAELQTRAKSLASDGNGETAERAMKAEMERIDRVSRVVDAAAARMDDVGLEVFERVFASQKGS